MNRKKDDMFKKIKAHLWESLCISGIPWPVLIFKVLVKGKELYAMHIRGQPISLIGYNDRKSAFVLAGIGWFCILLLNIQRYSMGKKVTLLSWMIKLDYEPAKITSRKLRELYPPIDDRYLSKTYSGGILVGKDTHNTGLYVRYPISNENTLAGALFCGGPGTGKTTLMISTILSMQNSDTTMMVVDIKPEIYDKTVNPVIHSNVKKIDPFDRKSYGFNLYYGISKKASDDEIMSEIDAICRSLISCPPDSRNIFFYRSGRNIVSGVLFYKLKKDWSEGRESTFMDGITFLRMESIQNRITQIIDEAGDCPEYIRVIKLLKPYADKKGEAMEAIESTISESLKILDNNNIIWSLGDAPKMAAPPDLENSSLYLCVPEYHLDEYSMILRLISESIIRYCSKRPDNADHKILLYLDEFPRLHLDAQVVLQGIALGRSRGLITILAAQTLQQIKSSWKKEDAKTLFELCQLMCFLSCADEESAKILCNWVGKYHEEHIQYTEGSQTSSYSRSFNEKSILEPSDLMTIQDKGEAIVFAHNCMMRVSAQDARYYRIESLNKLSQECLAINRT